MLPTISWLIEKKQLRLSLVSAAEVAPRGDAHITYDAAPSVAADYERRLTAPITWVHSSDLDDPTPFLSSGNVLLTDGMQFGLDDAAERYDYDRYVGRLTDAGIVGLGFATQFLHQGMPQALAIAAARAGLPLIDVPDRVPFIAVIREVADHIAFERNRRKEWSIAAHKAISRAALRPNGLRSILVELERQLSCWVGLFDVTGNPIAVPAQREMTDRFAPAVIGEVEQALRKGRRSSITLTLDSGLVTIQTLGHSGQLRGALALGRGVPLDQVENELVTSVIALATLALEQNRELESTQGHLRTALLELLLSGSVAAARASATAVWGPLPAEPFSVLVFPRDVRSHFVLDALEALVPESSGAIFFAVRGEHTVVLAEPASGRDPVATLLASHDVRAGSAGAENYADLNRAVGRATSALRAAHGIAGITDFAEIAGAGMLGMLHASGAEHVAHRVLMPLTTLDAAQSTALVATLRTWFEHDCSWGATAATLGVHRHTVRARVNYAAGILDLDLESFEGRLELWAALRMLS